MSNRFGLADLGYGLGLRATHYPYIFEHRPPIDWFEIISENFMDTGGKPRRMLEKVLEHYPVVMHGVSLSIGTVDPLDSAYLRQLKELAHWVNPPWISDHLCWTGIAHTHTHDLLPVPYTEEALTHIIDRIKAVQDALGRRILLENPSSYLEYTDSTMPEWEFLSRMAEDADCGLLLDVNNVYVACFNQRRNPKDYLDAIPYDRVVQVHLAGHTHMGTHIIDTHDDHVVEDVWKLYSYLVSKTGPVATMVEWDDKIPDFPVMMAELDKARQAAAQAVSINDLPQLEQPREPLAPVHQPYPEQLEQLQQAILQGDNKASQPERWIVAKPSFPPEAQLQAYINGYRYRLFDIVHEEYPVLRAYLGEDATNSLIRDFVNNVPSLHYNVSRYVERFPAFFSTRLSGAALDLAELETLISILFYAPETPALTQQHIAGLTPEQLMEMTLHPRAALYLCQYEHDVNAYYTAERQEESLPDSIAQKRIWLAAFRHEDRIWRIGLEEQEHRLLQLLFSGLTVGQALERLMEEHESDAETLPAKLSGWFSRWMTHGMLAAPPDIASSAAA